MFCVNDSGDLQLLRAEVDDYRKFKPGCPKIRKSLLFVNRRNLCDSLQLQNHSPIHNKIQNMPSNFLALKMNIDCFLSLKNVVVFVQNDYHSLFVNILNKAWTQVIIDFICGLDNFIRQLFFDNLGRHNQSLSRLSPCSRLSR